MANPTKNRKEEKQFRREKGIKTLFPITCAWVMWWQRFIMYRVTWCVCESIAQNVFFLIKILHNFYHG
jgi:hypothetical protein